MRNIGQATWPRTRNVVDRGRGRLARGVQWWWDMNNAELTDIATAIAARFETTITRAHDGASFIYRPLVTTRTETNVLGHSVGTRVVVSVPVNAVLTRKAALEMINAFRRELAAVAAPERIMLRTVKAKGGGRTSVHTSGYMHMGVFHVDGFWLSMSAEAA